MNNTVVEKGPAMIDSIVRVSTMAGWIHNAAVGKEKINGAQA